jgi:hypothetical protein
MEEQPKKKLNVDLSELEPALENNDEYIHYYLDVNTGAVVLVTEDMILELQDFIDDLDLDKEESETLLKALREREDPMLLEVYEIQQQQEVRFLEIRQEDRRFSYRAMESFIETLENRPLQNHLYNSIRAKGAFRNFKNTLSLFPQELERWYAYKDNLTKQEALRWLAQHGIEPIS